MLSPGHPPDNARTVAAQAAASTPVAAPTHRNCRARRRRARVDSRSTCTSGSKLRALRDRPMRKRSSTDIAGHLLSQSHGQVLPGSVQVLLHGRLGHLQQAGDLEHRPVLEVVERHRSPLHRCQRRHRGPHIRVGHWGFCRGTGLRTQLAHGPGPLTTDMTHGHPHRDLAGPSLGPLVVRNRGPLLEQLDEGLLGDFLGYSLAAHDQEDRAGHRAEPRAEDPLVVALLIAAHLVPPSLSPARDQSRRSRGGRLVARGHPTTSPITHHDHRHPSAVAAAQTAPMKVSSLRTSPSGASTYWVVRAPSVTWPVNFPTPSGGSTNVPTARHAAEPCVERMSHNRPWVMMVRVRSSPGTAKVSLKRT